MCSIISRLSTEAVAELGKDRFYIDAPGICQRGVPPTLHMAISDATGNNAIVEYIDGALSIPYR